MNHRSGVKKLGRDKAHKLSITRNLALSFFRYEKIKTTTLKAKLLRDFVEKIITRAKTDNLHNRRLVYRHIRDTYIIKKIFDDIGKRFQTRKGGYTRIYKIGQRKGDGAEICYIELTKELLDIASDSSKSDASGNSSNAEVANQHQDNLAPEVHERVEKKQIPDSEVQNKKTTSPSQDKTEVNQSEMTDESGVDKKG